MLHNGGASDEQTFVRVAHFSYFFCTQNIREDNMTRQQGFSALGCSLPMPILVDLAQWEQVTDTTRRLPPQAIRLKENHLSTYRMHNCTPLEKKNNSQPKQLESTTFEDTRLERSDLSRMTSDQLRIPYWSWVTVAHPHKLISVSIWKHNPLIFIRESVLLGYLKLPYKFILTLQYLAINMICMLDMKYWESGVN